MADTPQFDTPSVDAGICGFSLKIPIPSFSLNITIPSFSLQLPFTIPMPKFALSCDLSKPVSVSSGVPAGGGRTAQYDPDPDDEDQ